MISTQPAHCVLSVPLHNLPALWASIPAEQASDIRPPPVQRAFTGWCAGTHLESIIFLAASAYLNRSLRASSLYLIRDNLKHTHQYINNVPDLTEQLKLTQLAFYTHSDCHTQQLQTHKHLHEVRLSYLMGMSFMTSLNMDGEMTGSQSLGSSGS